MTVVYIKPAPPKVDSNTARQYLAYRTAAFRTDRNRRIAHFLEYFKIVAAGIADILISRHIFLSQLSKTR